MCRAREPLNLRFKADFIPAQTYLLLLKHCETTRYHFKYLTSNPILQLKTSRYSVGMHQIQTKLKTEIPTYSLHLRPHFPRPHPRHVANPCAEDLSLE